MLTYAGVVLGVVLALAIGHKSRSENLNSFSHTDGLRLMFIFSLNSALLPLHGYDQVLYLAIILWLPLLRWKLLRLLVLLLVCMQGYARQTIEVLTLILGLLGVDISASQSSLVNDLASISTLLILLAVALPYLLQKHRT